MTRPPRPCRAGTARLPGGHSVRVAAVITDDAGRVLVVQRRDTGKWEIPGGILEAPESIHAGPICPVSPMHLFDMR
jgi:8-oxo-dGTP pyrophosphatase MutT (NUDIX family)